MESGPCDRKEEGRIASHAGSETTSIDRKKQRSHAWRKVKEVAFRHMVSERTVRREFAELTSQERCKKEKSKS